MNTNPKKPCGAHEPPGTVNTAFGELPFGVFDLSDLTKEHLRTLSRWFAHLEQREERHCPTVDL